MKAVPMEGGSSVSKEGGERFRNGKGTSGEGRGEQGYVWGAAARKAVSQLGSGGVTVASRKRWGSRRRPLAVGKRVGERLATGVGRVAVRPRKAVPSGDKVWVWAG